MAHEVMMMHCQEQGHVLAVDFGFWRNFNMTTAFRACRSQPPYGRVWVGSTSSSCAKLSVMFAAGKSKDSTKWRELLSTPFKRFCSATTDSSSKMSNCEWGQPTNREQAQQQSGTSRARNGPSTCQVREQRTSPCTTPNSKFRVVSSPKLKLKTPNLKPYHS